MSNSELDKLHQSHKKRQRKGLKPFLAFMGYKPKVNLDSPNKEVISNNQHGASSWVNDLKLLPSFIYHMLFEVWTNEPENDPNYQYFPTVSSISDVNIMSYYLKHKRIVGILVLANIINLVNMLIPDSVFYAQPAEGGRQGSNNSTSYSISTGDRNSSNNTDSDYSQNGQGWIMNEDYWNYLKEKFQIALINVAYQGAIFCVSVLGIMSRSYNLKYKNCQVYLVLGLLIQYGQCAIIISYQQILFFNFFTNSTVLYMLMIFEISSNGRQVFFLSLNAFFSNFIVISNLKFNCDQDYRGQFINHEIIQRTYLFSMVLLITSIYQSQKINRNALSLLVDKVNELQHNLVVKENYNASMIHELRNPLSAVIGSIGLLKDSKQMSREDAETLNIASVSSDFLITLINNALDGAKLEANKLEIDCRMNDIIQVLTKSASLYHWKAQEKKVKIRLLIGKTIPDQVEIDDARLTQILVNLIGNAVKFTDENGSVKVRARFVECDSQPQIGVSEFDKSQGSRLRQDSEFQDDQEDDEYERTHFFEQQVGIDAQINEQNKNSLVNKMITFNDNDASVMQFEDDLNNDERSVSQRSYRTILKRDDSQNSLCNVSSLDEQQMNDKIYKMDNDLTIKNQIGEWLSFRDTAIKDLIVNNNNGLTRGSLSNIRDFQRIPTIQFIKQQSSEKSLVQSEAQKQSSSYSRSSVTRRKYQGPKDSYDGFSDSIPRDNSISMDSFNAPGDRGYSRTYTNSTGSNQMMVQKKNKGKSKFINQDISDDSGDESSKEQKRILKHRSLYVSEQGPDYLLSQNNLDEVSKDKHGQDSRGTLIIEVIDSGIGMTQEGIQKLFKPFSQADKSIQAKYGGTGLGLWITSKLIGIMKGTISVKSEVNKGTSFMLSIPVMAEYNPLFQSDFRQSFRALDTPPQFQKSQANRMNTSDDISSTNSVKVLLLQRDAMIRNLFKKYMTKSKIKSKFTSSYKEFMKAFKIKNYSACFIDLDTNIKVDELEQIMVHRDQLNERRAKGPYQEPNIKIYCFHSNEVEKAKLKVLRKYDIVYFKKPVQDYKLSSFLKKLKDTSDKEQQYSYNPSKKHQHQHSQGQDFFKIPYEQQNLKAPSMNLLPAYFRQRGQTVKETNKQSFSDGLTGYDKIQRKETIDAKIQQKDQINMKNNEIRDDDETRKNGDDSGGGGGAVKRPLRIPTLGHQKDWSYEYQQNLFQLDSSDDAESLPEIRRTNHQTEQESKDKLQFKRKYSRIDTPPADTKIIVGSFQDMLIMRNKVENNFQIRSSSLKNNIKKSSQHSRHSSQHYEEEEKSSRKSQQTANFHSNPRISDAFTNKHTHGGGISFCQNTIEQIDRSDSGEKLKNSIKSANFGNPPSLEEVEQAQSNAHYSQSISHMPNNKLNQGVLVILIVDDGKMNQHVQQKMMEKFPTVIKNKVQILVADDGLEGFNIFKAQESFKNGIIMNRVKLILMDCEMPVLDGYEATKKIRDYESNNYLNTNKTCIVGVSGNGGEQHARKCKQAGMNQTILKPITSDQLKSIVNNAILPFTKSQFSHDYKRQVI